LVDGGMMMPESYPFSSRLEVLCENGALEYAFRAGGRSVEMGGGVNELTFFPSSGDPLLLGPTQTDPYMAECAYFVDCIREGKPATQGTPAEGLQALAVALAARASLERGGEPVMVST
jgi:predicted dehydrogenase